MFFRDVPGQSELKSLFRTLHGSGRVPHALLLAESGSSGALAMALAFARLLNCSDPKDGEGCGSCTSCLQYSGMAHPDLLLSFPVVKPSSDGDFHSEHQLPEFRKAVLSDPFLSLYDWRGHMDPGNKQAIIPVREASRLMRSCTLKNFGGAFRVVLIWQAQKMNAESGNKLLKLIEEPPKGTLFLLIAPSPDDLLSTIVSRCQLIHVPPLSSEEIAVHLIVSGQTSDQNKAQMAASLADGDLRQAVRLLDLDDSLLQYTDWFVQLTRICYAARLTDLLNWTSELGKSTRDELIAFFRFSSHLLEESIRSRSGLDVPESPAVARTGFKMNVFSQLMPLNGLEQMSLEIDRSIVNVQRNVHAKLILFNLGVEMMRAFKLKE
jgi:DNA polymerase-3 subunit delta'